MGGGGGGRQSTFGEFEEHGHELLHHHRSQAISLFDLAIINVVVSRKRTSKGDDDTESAGSWVFGI